MIMSWSRSARLRDLVFRLFESRVNIDAPECGIVVILFQIVFRGF